MADLSFLQLLLLAYLSLVVIKTLLCYAMADVALAVLRRRFAARHQFVWCVLIAVVVPVAVAVLLPKLLMDEGMSFFLVYNRQKVMRDMLAAI